MPSDLEQASAYVERVLAGNIGALARVLRWLDDNNPKGLLALRQLYPKTGNAFVLGITGAPGVGKSTLTDNVISQYRARGQKVAVLAIDPTSPFTGGAILGDRIRMRKHESDPEVYIRSIATRGALGGLSHSTSYCIMALDAAGYDIIILETVGVGQDEIDVVREADTSLVVTVPGMGDDIQAIKAGILEIADVFVINKSDREGVDHTEKDLRIMLELERDVREWTPPIVRSVANRNEGVDRILDAIDQHREFDTDRKRESHEAFQVEKHLRWHLERLAQSICDSDTFARLVAQTKSKEIDPFTAAEEIVKMLPTLVEQE